MDYFRNLDYPENLEILKNDFEDFFNNFQIHFPSGSKEDLISHYINYYKDKVKAIESTEKGIREYIDQGHVLAKTKEDKKILEDFEVDHNKKLDALINKTFEYNRIIDWLKSCFLTDLQNDENQDKLSALETAYYAYYLVNSKCYNVKNMKKMDWIKVMSDMNGGHSLKNVQIKYNEILKDKDVRLRGRSKIIQTVIKRLELFQPYPKDAIQMAENDLKNPQTNP